MSGLVGLKNYEGCRRGDGCCRPRCGCRLGLLRQPGGAAANLPDRIVERINHLAIPGLAHVGRLGWVPGTRELVVPPYIVVYGIDIHDNEIQVLAIFHAAQDRRRTI